MLAMGLKVFNSYCSFTKVSAVKSGGMNISFPAVQRLASCHHVLQGSHLIATTLLLVSIYTTAVVNNIECCKKQTHTKNIFSFDQQKRWHCCKGAISTYNSINLI